MSLNWKEHNNANPQAPTNTPEHLTYLAQAHEYDTKGLNSAVACSIDKAVSLLNDNINEHSRYLIFEWDITCSVLTIVVTDDKKENDSAKVVQCCFTALDNKLKAVKNTALSEWESEANRYAECMKDTIRDYLTTCHTFFSYSLVAIFHTDGRSNSALL